MISRSQGDAQPVFQAIAGSARQLLDAHSALVARRIDDMLHVAALTGTNEFGDEALRKLFPVKLTGQAPLGKAVLSGKPAWVYDYEADPTYSPSFREMARARGFRALLAVPMIREGCSIGGIAVTFRNSEAFTDRQIKLLETFADQAVIAIENTHSSMRLSHATVNLLKRLSNRRQQVRSCASSAARQQM